MKNDTNNPPIKETILLDTKEYLKTRVVPSPRFRSGRSETRFELCGERLLIEDYKLKNKIGRIILPSGVQSETLAKSRVVAIGPDIKTVLVGDIILSVPDLGTTIKDGKRIFRMIPANMVIAIDKKFNKKEECPGE